VLADLREARGDLDAANASLVACESDAEDRYAEAETRLEDLREEFDVRFVSVAGLTVADVMKAREECLL
jgi:ABC-type phosphate transport system auxiliary subunit